MIEEFSPPCKIWESTTPAICSPFSFSFLPGKVDQRKIACFSLGLMATYIVVRLPTRMPSWSKNPFTSKGAGSKKTCTENVFFSTFSSPKAKGETVSLSFCSSFAFPWIDVAGAKPALFAPQIKKVRGKHTFFLCTIRKRTTHSIPWAHRIKCKAMLSWKSFRQQETLELVGASEQNKSKPKMDQDSLPAKPISKGTKNGICKVDRAPIL
ncbi:hypothetical protein ACH5RR_012729 [Cinchona calisaya]|uniref:Uncharacterized protein n=1 Tax=Cinchona calisaya TaxID=153742 RepID=A0ABD3A945_9GENT